MALPLILAGAALAAQLGAGIYNAAQQPKRKREWKREQKRGIAEDAMMRMSARAHGGEPGAELVAALRAKGIDRAAEQNFKLDPMSFVPFAQSAASFANQAYDYAQQPKTDLSGLQQEIDAKKQDAEALRYFRANGWQGYGTGLR